MRRNFLITGLLLMFFGLATSFIAPGFPTTASVSKSLLINPKTLSYFIIGVNQTGTIVMTFSSNQPVDFYLANESAFAQISSANISTFGTRSKAQALEGAGVYGIYENSTFGTYPNLAAQNVSNQTQAPIYMANTTALKPGNYYAIFVNSGGALANVEVSEQPVSLQKIESNINTLGLYGIVSFLTFAAGLVLVVYSLIARGKSKQDELIDAEAAKEYERIEKEERRGRKTRQTKRKAR